MEIELLAAILLAEIQSTVHREPLLPEKTSKPLRVTGQPGKESISRKTRISTQGRSCRLLERNLEAEYKPVGDRRRSCTQETNMNLGKGRKGMDERKEGVSQEAEEILQ